MKVKFVGHGRGQIGTIPDEEQYGMFFRVFKPGEEVEIPESLVNEIRASSEGWRERGFVLLEQGG
jgi:hypothetical protein